MAVGSAQATLLATPTCPFAHLDDGFTASLYATSSQGCVGLAWDSAGNLLRSDGGQLYVHSQLADTRLHGSNTLHSSVAHEVGGTGLGGYGMTLGLDGFVYAQGGGGGMKKVDTTTFTSTVALGSGPGSAPAAPMSSPRLGPCCARSAPPTAPTAWPMAMAPSSRTTPTARCPA